MIDLEVTVVAIVAADFVAQRTVSAEDWQRLAVAAGRIQSARDSLHER